MRDHELRKQIHHMMDTQLSGVKGDPYLAQRIIVDAKGGQKVKRKISVGLVFCFVLLALSVVAVAATLLWQDYVPHVKQAEQEIGDYAQWSDAKRIQLAQDIIAMGYGNESDAAAVLQNDEATETEKAAAADRMMLELTGLNDVKEIHSTLITYSLMGHEDTWTAEQRVWWNGIINLYANTDAPDTLLVPSKEDLSEEDAIAIAKAAVQEAYGFGDDFMASLHAVANLYVTDQRPDYKRWDIQFKKYRDNSTYLEKVYSVVVDENGEVISDPDVGIEHPAERAERDAAQSAEQEKAENPELAKVYSQYGRENQSIWRLTLEEKASLLGDDNGLPDNQDITETEAIQIAVNRLASIGYSMDSYEVSVWYKICDDYAADSLQQKPFYVIYFLDDLDEPAKAFSVAIDAACGEVLQTYTPQSISLY